MVSDNCDSQNETKELKKKIKELSGLVNVLKLSEQKWHLMYNSLPGGIFTVNSDFIIEDVNEFLCKLSGYSREELVGNSCGIICPKGPHKCPIFDLGKDRIDNDETSVRNRDGDFVPVIKSALRIPFGTKDLIVENFQDISERKQLENERLRASNLESIGVLAGGIAHDFNNILTSILGNVSLASSLASEDENISSILGDAESACGRAKSLAEQLLTFSKGGEPVKKVVDIKELIRQSSHFVLHGSNVKVSYRLDPELWPVEVDVGQIHQVISNVVINAKQAMPNGGEICIIASNVAFDEDDQLSLPAGKYVRIEIEDSGTGIASEVIEKVFNPYFTTKDAGSGLGLATCYSIIKRHCGKIFIRNRPRNRGTRVILYLPASGTLPEVESYETDSYVSQTGCRVLVMDDELAIREVVSNMLGYLGHRPEVAEDGWETVKRFEELETSANPFQLVILDLTIPGGMGGVETARKLREIRPDVTILVSSGYSDHKVMSDYRRYGFQGSIIKPYRVEELSAAINKVLGSKV